MLLGTEGATVEHNTVQILDLVDFLPKTNTLAYFEVIISDEKMFSSTDTNGQCYETYSLVTDEVAK